MRNKKLLVMLDGYDQIKFLNMQRYTTDGRETEINIVEEIFTSLKEYTPVESIKIVITCGTEILNYKKNSEIVNIFSLKEEGEVYHAKYLTQFKISPLSYNDLNSKKMEDFIMKIKECVKANVNNLWFKIRVFDNHRKYIDLMKEYRLDKELTSQYMCQIIIQILPHLKKENKKPNLLQIMREYSDLKIQNRFFAKKLTQKFNKFPIYKPSVENKKINSENFLEICRSICFEFAYVIARYGVLEYKPNTENINFWNYLFGTTSKGGEKYLETSSLNSDRLEDQAYYDILLCLPIKINPTSTFKGDNKTNDREIHFNHEFIKSYWISELIFRFNNPSKNHLSFEILFRVFETHEMHSQTVKILGDSKDQSWLQALCRWFIAVYGEKTFRAQFKMDCEIFLQGKANIYDSQIKKFIERQDFKDSETLIINLTKILLYNPLENLDNRLMKDTIRQEQSVNQSPAEAQRQKSLMNYDKNFKSDVVKKIVFDIEDWDKYFGCSPTVDIKQFANKMKYMYGYLYDFLNTPCRVWLSNNLRVQETHFAVYIPRIINGKPLTVQLIEEVLCTKTNQNINKPFRNTNKYPDNLIINTNQYTNNSLHNTNQYAGNLHGNTNQYADDLYDITTQKMRGNPISINFTKEFPKEMIKQEKLEAGYWVLMTKDVLPNTRGQDYKTCTEIVKKHGYDAPSLHEA